MLTKSPRDRVRQALFWVFVLVLGGVVLSWGWSGLARRSVADGIAAYRRGDWMAASKLAQERLRRNQDDAGALRLLARASARLGRHPAARVSFSLLGAQGLDPEDHFLMGLGWRREGRFEAAMQEWKSALAADPDHAETLNELARFSMHKDHLMEGARIAQRLARQPGWEARGDLLLGMIQAADHDPVGATEALQRALRRDPSARLVPTERFSTQKLLARTLLQSGRSAEARETVGAVLEAGPDPEASWLLNRVFLQEGNRAAAAAALGQAGTYRADHPLEAEPAPYVGEARCTECHREISGDVLASRHARTLLRGHQLDDLPLPDHAVPDPRDPTVTHVFKRSEGQVHLQTRVAGQVLRAVVDYALGAPDRYTSLVGRDQQGQLRVLRLSYHQSTEKAGWDRTKLQAADPRRPEDFLGETFESADHANECLTCHATTARSARERTGPESADHAIGCEGCHGPGGLHLMAVAAGSSDLAIANPTHAPAAGVNRLCGHCHSQHLKEMPPSLADRLWARFPGSILPQSRCYTESGGALSCVTCHDPHRDVETSPGYYETKCLTCHASSTKAGAARLADEAFRSPCPVNATKDCLSCHMRKVPYPTLHTSFTDHYIRVPSSPAPRSAGGASPAPAPAAIPRGSEG